MIFVLLVAMMMSIFVSRAALSITMILFIIGSFLHYQPRLHLRNFIRSVLLVSMTFLFLVPLISGLWSENKETWFDIVRIKLPLLLLPIAFATPVSIGKKDWRSVVLIFILMAVIACCWTFLNFLANASNTNDGYLQSKLMDTPFENDHVRFSWFIALASIVSLYFSVTVKQSGLRIMLLTAFVLMIVFLHFLAARTGLLVLYIAVFILIIWMMVNKTRRIALSIAAILLVLPVIAWVFIPTFQNRLKVFRFEMDYFLNSGYLPSSTDASRRISWNAGWEIMNNQPATGVGFGDIGSEMNKKYNDMYPGMREEDKILPSSQWLMYGAGSGWTGFMIFSAIVTCAFFTPFRKHILWIILNIAVLISFITDIPLEVQYGVFLYSFMILCCWKWLKEEKPASLQP